MTNEISIPLDRVTFRDDLYCRMERDSKLVQRYAADLDVLPPIEVNQHDELIDGWHRWTAHKKAGAERIRVTVTETASDAELLALAIRRNAKHGKQLTEADKKSMAIRLYACGTSFPKDEIAEVLSVSRRMVNVYLSETDRDLREQRRKRVFDLWLACHTQEEIAETVDVDKSNVCRQVEDCCDLETFPNRNKHAALFQDDAFRPQIYNVWAFAKKTNEASHSGNSDQRILENLLYLYTEPFDIVIDPFAGGGSTIDVCKTRFRRFWASDRKPVVERESEIRQLDVVQQLPPLRKRWNEVRLAYLDPPYWRQAKGWYSEDAEDLANMSLDDFHDALSKVVNALARKMPVRSHIALLIQPTQWNADDRQYTDHVTEMVVRADAKRLSLRNRVSCPYPTEQCKPQQVEWAKANRELLVLSRELIIWRVTGR